MPGYRYLGEEYVGIIPVTCATNTIAKWKVFIIIGLDPVNSNFLILGNILIIRRGRSKFKKRFINRETLNIDNETVDILFPRNIDVRIPKRFQVSTLRRFKVETRWSRHASEKGFLSNIAEVVVFPGTAKQFRIIERGEELRRRTIIERI